MRHLSKKWFSIAGLLLLISCSSGPSTSLITESLDTNSRGGKVFVVRDTGSMALIYKISVTINGRSAGKVGMKGTAVGSSTIGTNKVTVKMNGLGGIGMSDGIAFFEDLSGERNRFFIIGLRQNLWSAELILQEISEDQFRSKALNNKWTEYL